jgi:DNA invertase Pin-like site-specific DNA recombinase
MNKLRCAIYTRKSSEDGLEQEFNSLDAQREACAAYIASQKHEGWVLLPEHYDDGGLSGGSLERPALQQLLRDIADGRVDQIVVYKIDRLTRSLADFAKLVDRLDEAGASFVSVTQSFNTSTSMGRLTLNVLLSFAQFEREVTAERIRDKIAASKRKGLWMGGNVPLGYDPDGRTLKINIDEAQTIKTIYGLYDEHRAMNQVREQAEHIRLRSKRCRLADGSQRGGHVMSRGQLHHILTNPIYAGRIRHKGQVFEGQHPAIIDPERWDRLQQQLSCKSAKERNTKQHRDPSPLAGKIMDEAGQKLTPSHTKKGDRRYRYYISQKLVTGVNRADDKQRTWRIPAAQLEDPIGGAVQRHVRDLRKRNEDQIIAAAEEMVIDHNDALEMIESVKIKPGRVTIQLDRKRFQACLKSKTPIHSDALQLILPFTERRRGVEMKLIIEGDTTVDDRLMRNIANANQWYKRIKEGATFDQISDETGTSKRRIQQMIHLAFLAPDIVRQIMQGKQPMGLTSDWLLRHDLPAEWDAQRERIANL